MAPSWPRDGWRFTVCTAVACNHAPVRMKTHPRQQQTSAMVKPVDLTFVSTRAAARSILMRCSCKCGRDARTMLRSMTCKRECLSSSVSVFSCGEAASACAGGRGGVERASTLSFAIACRLPEEAPGVAARAGAKRLRRLFSLSLRFRALYSRRVSLRPSWRGDQPEARRFLACEPGMAEALPGRIPADSRLAYKTAAAEPRTSSDR